MTLTECEVRRSYDALLKRQPSQRELHLWKTRSDASNSELASKLLLQATEVRSVSRLYIGLLGRLPECLSGVASGSDGLKYWVEKLRAFRSEYPDVPYKSALTYLIEDWFYAPEFLDHYGENPPIVDYVRKLSQALLARSVTDREAEVWSQVAEEPEAGRAQLAVNLAESDECKQRLNETIDALLLARAEEHREGEAYSDH